MRFHLPGVLVLGLALAGCSDDGPADPGAIPYETDLSVPAHVLTNLALAYANRDDGVYADLLGADYVFFPSFFSPWGQEAPDRAKELAVTRAMFLSPRVADIRLELGLGDPEEALFGGVEEVVRIRTASLLLEVDLDDDVTYQVWDHIQQFYLRPGRPEYGEDPGRYYLRAWDDTGVPVGSLRAADTPVPVDERTWSAIKKEFDE